MDWTKLFANDFFSGGLALAGIAAVVTFLRRYIVLAMRRLVVEVEVREWDMVMWLGLWLAHTDYGKRCRKLTTNVVNQEGGDAALFFEPGLGPHIFRFEKVWVLVDRRVDKEENVWNRREWYSVRVLGSRAVATKLIEDAKTFAMDLLARRHTAFISDGKGEWKRVGVGAPRALSTVVLPGNTSASIADRIRKFRGSRDWYAARGIPWRIGFGLFGPPRTGKTSVVRAIACELGLPLYVLDLASKEFSDRDLIVTLAKVPVGAIVLIEDIDAQLDSKSSEITLSGLLNALDGPLASEGRVLFVTSNTFERLDAALVGEGRLDVHVHFSYATTEQVHAMFLRFFPGHDDSAAEFAAAVPRGVIPPAAIQEHLVARSDNPRRAVEEARLLARKEVRVVERRTPTSRGIRTR